MTTAPSVPIPDQLPASARERWRTYLVCLLGWMFDFYDLVLFAFLAKAIGASFHWGDAYAHNKALLVGIALAASGLGGVAFGGLADAFGRRAVMAWTIVVYSMGTGLCGLSVGLASLALFRAFTGFGVGGEWATGHALMAEIFPKERRGWAAALLQAGEPLGVALAVVMGLWVEPRIGWRWVFWLSTLPAALVVLVRRRVRESPMWTKAHVREHGRFFDRYRILLRDYWRPVLQGLVLCSSKMGTYWVTYVWLPEYFDEMQRMTRTVELGGGLSLLQLKFILVAQGGQLAGMLLFGLVADALGRRPAFTLYSLLTAAGLLAMSVLGSEIITLPALFWPVMLAVGVGSGCTAGFGALLAEIFPTSIRNTCMGTVYNVSRAFQLIPQMVMGSLVAAGGASSGYLLAVAMAVVTAGWVWTFPETRGAELNEE